MGEDRNGATWYRLSPDDALNELGVDREGLSRDEARSRLEQYGPNSIETGKEVTWWSVLLDQFTSPLIYVLIAALVVTVAIQSWGDVIVIAAVLAINGTIGFIQEYRAESAVQSLMEMVSPKARVKRGGELQEIKADDIVPGDCVALSDGDMVPADLRLLSCRSLQVNEAALTGESVPVRKTDHALEDAEENLPPADQENMAFMGTAVTSGGAEGLVVATGPRTQLGQIAEDVRTAGDIQTPLQHRMDRLAKWIAVLILIVAAIAFGVGLLMGKSVTQMFLLAVSLSVAAIPAGLPVVMTVALAIGVRRMARQHAVIRHLPAVETLGSTTSILSDKTGTLTQNRMTVRHVIAGDDSLEVAGKALDTEGEIRRQDETIDVQGNRALYYTLLAGMLNNEAKLQHGANEEKGEDRDGEGDLQPTGDPMEAALLVSGLKAGLSRDELVDRYPKKDEVPFQTERRFSATIHEVPEDEDGPLVLVKGAPEVILEMCQRRLTADGNEENLNREAGARQNEELARQGNAVKDFFP